MAHIRYADFFTYIFIENSDKDELECILKFLKEIILDENYSLQGISWVLHNVKSYGKGCYLRNNLINAKLYRGVKGIIKTLLDDVILSFKVLFKKNKCKMKKFLTIYKGIFAYIFRIYDTKEVKNRFKI